MMNMIKDFINSDEIDIINTTHANFENTDIQAKFKLGLMLEESTPCHQGTERSLGGEHSRSGGHRSRVRARSAA
jgi:hypothetical protein